MKHGRVTHFDEHVGLGIIESEGESYPFHCVNIADGSRAIDVGTDVAFEVYFHPRGRNEARGITPQ